MSWEIHPLHVKLWYHLFSSTKMEKYIESEHPDIFRSKLVKNIALVSMGIHFMQIMVKRNTFFLVLHSFEYELLFLDARVDEGSEKFSNSKSLASECCLAFAWFSGNFNLALLIKVLLITKACWTKTEAIHFKVITYLKIF